MFNSSSKMLDKKVAGKDSKYKDNDTLNNGDFGKGFFEDVSLNHSQIFGQTESEKPSGIHRPLAIVRICTTSSRES